MSTVLSIGLVALAAPVNRDATLSCSMLKSRSSHLTFSPKLRRASNATSSTQMPFRKARKTNRKTWNRCVLCKGNLVPCKRTSFRCIRLHLLLYHQSLPGRRLMRQWNGMASLRQRSSLTLYTIWSVRDSRNIQQKIRTRRTASVL